MADLGRWADKKTIRLLGQRTEAGRKVKGGNVGRWQRRDET
jgi:hypothetical protein